jgi:hypothetical protein
MTEADDLKDKGLGQLSKMSREQFLVCVEDYVERQQLKDMARAVVRYDVDMRDDLCSIVDFIFSKKKDREQIKKVLEYWYDELSNAFYKFCDVGNFESNLGIIWSMNGTRFKPPIEQILDGIYGEQ